ncbi:LOW QUALITY PROTEIN: rho GTPase-activating protein SYDE2-like [Mustelus asterias]
MDTFRQCGLQESEVLESLPVSVCSEAVQVVKCECADPWTERGDVASACWGPNEPLPVPSASGTSAATSANYPDSAALATRPSRDPGTSATGPPAGDARRTIEGGEIWYNPIPEDDVPVRPPRRPGTSRAQWYVEVPCPPAAGEGTRQHGGVVAVPSGAEATPEQPTARCAARSSPQNTHRPSIEMPVAGVSWSSSQCGSSVQKAEPSDGVTVSGTDRNPSPVSSPRPPKKSAAAHRSLSDRVKSPGTVRRLSMKMKKLPELRRKLSLRGTSRPSRHDNDAAAAPGGARPEPSGRVTPPLPASPSSSPTVPPPVSNVICRYHLDSSVSARGSWHRRKQRCSRAPGKAGYLSDGDSPELVTKAGKAGPWHPEYQQPAGARLDTGAFRPYGSSEQLRCLQYLSGLLNVRLYGIEGLRLPRAGLRDVFCAIQVDSVSKAHTAMLTCQEPFLSLDHTFNIELEHSQLLKLLLYSWDPTSSRNRLCCHGTAVLPPLFKGARTHQLAMRLEPRGVLYLKVSLVELWEVPLCGGEELRESMVFRVELSELVERESSGVPVPLLIQKCVSEIERRGLKAVGLYRLCGSAAVKKELRDSFERDSASVNLSEEIYPDINVITGILKDYLRELPSPLITKTLYEVVLEAMTKWPLKMTLGVPEAGPIPANAVALLDCLPEVEKVTPRARRASL